MSDVKIHTQRSWEPSPEPKKEKSADTVFFALPKTIVQSEQKINIKTIFSHYLAQGLHIDTQQYPMDDLVASLIQDYSGDRIMKSSHKKDKNASALDAEEDLEPEVKEFAETLIESLKEDYNSNLEPFEIYAQKVRGHIYGNAKSFKKRFSKGYQILLSELEKKSPPDPTAIKP